jgi:hypothetical protein
MRRILPVFLMTLVILTSLGGSPAHADDCRLGRTPEGVYPLEDSSITMVDEVILIRLDHERSYSPVTHVSCEFTFTNAGPPDTILMGFPTRLRLAEDEDPAMHDLETSGFEASVDGRPVEVTFRHGLKPPGTGRLPEVSEWATFEVSFASGQRRVIRHSYTASCTVWSNGEVLAGYILTTGALWAQPIGHVRVEFDMGAVSPWYISRMFPSGWTFQQENTWVYEASDLRPQHDLAIIYNCRPLLDDPNMPEHLGPKAYAAWRAEFEQADRAARSPIALRDLLGKVRDKILAGGPRVEELQVLAAYVMSLMDPDQRPEPAAPEITHLTAVHSRAEGRWVVETGARDLDADLTEIALVAFVEKEGQRTVCFELSERLEFPSPWYSRSIRREVDFASDVPLQYVRIQARATDAAGNTVLSEPLQLPLPPPPGVTTGETTGPGPAVGTSARIRAVLDRSVFGAAAVPATLVVAATIAGLAVASKMRRRIR